MNWLSIYKDGTPNRGRRVLTWAEIYKDKPDLAFRILDGQFVHLCKEVTHYSYLIPPGKGAKK